MRTLILSYLTILAVTLIISSLNGTPAAETDVSYSSSAHDDEQPPHHMRLLQQLLDHDELQPSLADIHPVTAMYNREAIIPPQCYTRHDKKHNPCYVCHQDAQAGHENTMNDSDLQRAYSFSDLGMTNHWKNLFEDRSERVAQISDASIIDWINKDNYTSLAPRLERAGFEGWIPDLKNLQHGKAAFDEHGFAKDGSHWVAFNYKPFPSTFWPTNGSTDDVMIRLPAEFRQDDEGNYQRDVYRANLAIVEATLKNLPSISTLPVNENILDKDINGDGELTVTNRISDITSYVGAAANIYKEPFLYPAGTEFFHTVRYIGLNDDGTTGISTRMKEVRYMKKWRFFNKSVYKRYYDLEAMEKDMGHLPGYTHLGDHGLDNSFGWSIQSFIEDRKGELRVATYEENTFCMGCHSSIGATIDKTFSFARKIDGAAGWGYIDLKAMHDAPSLGESRGEISTYLERVGGGSEFRNNDEMRARWFLEDGSLDRTRVDAARTVYELITPSAERAMLMNKAYRVIVDDQDFMFGRDATVTPPQNVFEKVDNSKTLPLPADKFKKWDIRLDWTSGKENLAGN